MKKVKRFIVCCSSHCTFTSFVNCPSSCFYFYANRRNLFQNSAHMRRVEIESQKGEVSILVVCFFFFSNCCTHMFKVMKVDVKWLYAKMRDREKIRPSNIRDLSKSQPTSFVWFSVIYQLCVCNNFIRFVPVRIRFQFLMFVWVVSYFFVIINRFCLIIIIGKEKLYAQSCLGCRLGVFSQVLLKFSFPENLFRFFFVCVLRTNESRDLVIKYLAHVFFSPVRSIREINV